MQDGQRKSPDATSALRKSVTSGTPTPNSEVNKRRAAADFIKQCTGLDVPYSNDLNFRQALRDGVVLCETLNKVRPNAVAVRTAAWSCIPTSGSHHDQISAYRFKMGTEPVSQMCRASSATLACT